MKFLVLFLSAVVVVSSGPIAQEDSVLKLVAGNFVNCMNSDLNLCLKEHALKATERLGSLRKLNLIDGITIYNNGPKEARSYEPLSSDSEIRNKQLTERLWDTTTDLLERSDLELSYNGGDEEEEKQSSRAIEDEVDEGRGKKKKQLKKKLKLLIPLAIIAKAKAVALVVLALLVIAASLFKLAVLAKIAFIAKIIAIVKALIAKKHAQEEHGWVSHEEHVHPPAAGWEGGWSRSRNEANSLAYSAYQQ